MTAGLVPVILVLLAWSRLTYIEASTSPSCVASVVQCVTPDGAQGLIVRHNSVVAAIVPGKS